MKTIQVQGVHHITIVGSTRQSAIDSERAGDGKDGRHVAGSARGRRQTE